MTKAKLKTVSIPFETPKTSNDYLFDNSINCGTFAFCLAVPYEYQIDRHWQNRQ